MPEDIKEITSCKVLRKMILKEEFYTQTTKSKIMMEEYFHKDSYFTIHVLHTKKLHEKVIQKDNKESRNNTSDKRNRGR